MLCEGNYAADEFQRADRLGCHIRTERTGCVERGRAIWAGLGIPRGYRPWAQTVRLPVVARNSLTRNQEAKTPWFTQSPANARDIMRVDPTFRMQDLLA